MMDNVVLGKLLKAMQKMSGKSITALSDESGLTVDTINNLFYARIQKPGFEGVCTLSEIMGFPVEKLLEYMKDEEIGDMEVSEITEYLAEHAEGSAEDTNGNRTFTAASAKGNAASAKAELSALGEAHEKEIERIRASYARSVENLREQRTESLRQMKESYEGLERTLEEQIALLKEERQKDLRNYERSLQETEKHYRGTIEKLENSVTSQRKTIKRCFTALILLLILIIVMLVIDRLSTGIGWIR